MIILPDFVRSRSTHTNFTLRRRFRYNEHLIQAKGNYFNSKSFFINETQYLIYSGESNEPLPQPRERNLSTKQLLVYAKNVSELNSAPELNGFTVINNFSGFEYNTSMIRGKLNEHYFTSAVSGTRVYLYNNIDFVEYDCEQNRWFKLLGYRGIFAPTMSFFGSCIYMAGGLAFDEWCPVTSKQQSSAAAKMSNPISSKSLRCFDVRENKGSQLPDMKYDRVKAASCVHNGIIYVSGGDNLSYYNNAPVEFYDIRAGKWNKLLTPMPRAKVGHCCVTYNDQLWFFGGQIPECTKYNVSWFSYHLKENTWSEIFSVPSTFGDHTIERILDVYPGVNT